MSQFRSAADIADEVLQKCGEVTNGNSPYESLVLTYLNKAQQAIVGGGNIFSLKVDELWTWARNRWPIILELEPAYTTGTIAITQDDVNIVFSDAPATSREGWHLQILGKHTIYKVTQHSAGDPSAQLDSSMLTETGTYNFRLFKVDYEIKQTYLYVDAKNDKLDFCEVLNTPLVATLTRGSYTPAALITHIVAKLNAAGTNGLYSGSYDSVLKLFTITSSGSGGKILSFLGATGTNRKRSSLPLLGLDQKDHTGALTYTSTYIINGISRLCEPFKVFSFSAGSDNQITASDPFNMEVDYPLAEVPERIPDRFCFTAEENDGTKHVRFNAYPRTKTKVVIDWVEMPRDLQDNAACIPVIPRKDIDVLIHGACTYLLFDKEDSKWQNMLTVTKAQLEAMEKKNRSELFRTGPLFGQIVPRLDLAKDKRKLKYGYTVSQATGSDQTAGQTAQTMVTKQLTYVDFQTGALTKTVVARILPGNRSLFSLIVKLTQQFAGGSISALTLDLGISGDATKFINGFDLLQLADAQDSVLSVYYPGVNTEIQARVTAVSDNLSALNAGSLDLYFSENIVVPS